MVAPRIVFEFEQLTGELSTPPLAATRALRIGGVHLSRTGWLTLTEEARWLLARLGTQQHIDTEQLRQLLRHVPPRELQLAPSFAEPHPTRLPDTVVAALGPTRAIENDGWAKLSPLERWALASVATNRHLLGRALEEILRRYGRMFRTQPGIWRGEVGHAEVQIDGRALLRLQSVEFEGGRAFVLARVSGVRAARASVDLLDARSQQPIGPVQVAPTTFLETSLARIVWQAHVSTATGEFAPGASLLAAVTAATALADLAAGFADLTVLCVTNARIKEETWLADRDDADEPATRVHRLGKP